MKPSADSSVAACSRVHWQKHDGMWATASFCSLEKAHRGAANMLYEL
jgi:hypothetical protein